MLSGTRVVHPDEINRWDAEIFQISVYRGMNNNLAEMRECAKLCRDRAVPFVIHPVGYSLQDKEMLADIKEMAHCTDLALILHDERKTDGSRLSGEDEAQFRYTIKDLSSITEISFENATDTSDVHWFWDTYADSTTLDIGHVESAGYDSVNFVKSLDKTTIDKIRFVHIHRNNGYHGGITDHWPIKENCREIRALKELLLIRPTVNVILELNEIEMVKNNLDLLASLKEELGL